MNIEAFGRISRKGDDLTVIVPRKDRHLFNLGDKVLIVKVDLVPAKMSSKKEA